MYDCLTCYDCPMKARGFTLIEVIIAVVVVGMLVVLASTLVQAVGLTRHAKNKDVAAKVAESKLESLRAVGYEQLPAGTPFTDPLLEVLPDGVGSFTVDDFSSTTKHVIVTVSWSDPGATSQTTLTISTLVAKVGGIQ